MDSLFQFAQYYFVDLLQSFKIQLAQPSQLNKPFVGLLYRLIYYLFY